LISFQNLEKKLSYEDLRFYRSIARSRLRKDQALRRRVELEQKKQLQQVGGWTTWLWGSSKPNSSAEDPAFGGQMTDEQRKQLYDALDYDEKSAVVDSLSAPQDALKARMVARLNKGTLALTIDPHDNRREVVSIVFDALQATFIQRPENLEASVSLGGFGVFDGTTKNTLYPQIVQVKRNRSGTVMDQTLDGSPDEPFFFVKFEQNPLNKRANNALTVRLRHMEIIYHKGYVEAIYQFFKPPDSQLESVEALLVRLISFLPFHYLSTLMTTASIERCKSDARSLPQGDTRRPRVRTSKTQDNRCADGYECSNYHYPRRVRPFVVPFSFLDLFYSITTDRCKHLVIDAGHIAIRSDLAPESVVREVQSKRNQKLDAEAQKRLDSLMYDKMSLRLADAQVYAFAVASQSS
jgi:vacuolar protein sorting-associated protein 13A/C